MVTVPCSGAVPNAQVPPTSAPILSLVATLPVAVVLMAVLKLSFPALGASSRMLAEKVLEAVKPPASCTVTVIPASTTLVLAAVAPVGATAMA